MNLIPYGYLDVDNIYQPNFNLTHEEIVELIGKPLYEKEQFESELNKFQERYSELLSDFKIENFSNDAYDTIFANGKRLGVIETENRLWKAMQLTDEEIIEIAKECKAPWHSHAIDPMIFARAILRKAQKQ